MVKRPSVLMHSPYVAGLQKYSRKASKACIGAEVASPRGISLTVRQSDEPLEDQAQPQDGRDAQRDQGAEPTRKVGPGSREDREVGLASPQPPPDKPQQS